MLRVIIDKKVFANFVIIMTKINIQVTDILIKDNNRVYIIILDGCGSIVS